MSPPIDYARMIPDSPRRPVRILVLAIVMLLFSGAGGLYALLVQLPEMLRLHEDTVRQHIPAPPMVPPAEVVMNLSPYDGDPIPSTGLGRAGRESVISDIARRSALSNDRRMMLNHALTEFGGAIFRVSKPGDVNVAAQIRSVGGGEIITKSEAAFPPAIRLETAQGALDVDHGGARFRNTRGETWTINWHVVTAPDGTRRWSHSAMAGAIESVNHDAGGRLNALQAASVLDALKAEVIPGGKPVWYEVKPNISGKAAGKQSVIFTQQVGDKHNTILILPNGKPVDARGREPLDPDTGLAVNPPPRKQAPILTPAITRGLVTEGVAGLVVALISLLTAVLLILDVVWSRKLAVLLLFLRVAATLGSLVLAIAFFAAIADRVPRQNVNQALRNVAVAMTVQVGMIVWIAFVVFSRETLAHFMRRGEGPWINPALRARVDRMQQSVPFRAAVAALGVLGALLAIAHLYLLLSQPITLGSVLGTAIALLFDLALMAWPFWARVKGGRAIHAN